MKNSTHQQNRETLKALSNSLRPLVKSGQFDSINDGLLTIYREQNPGIREFRTFFQWKQAGKVIKKGSKAFAVWGQPVKAKAKEEPEKQEPEEFEYFPLCYLFADTQVN